MEWYSWRTSLCSPIRIIRSIFFISMCLSSISSLPVDSSRDNKQSSLLNKDGVVGELSYISDISDNDISNDRRFIRELGSHDVNPKMEDSNTWSISNSSFLTDIDRSNSTPGKMESEDIFPDLQTSQPRTGEIGRFSSTPTVNDGLEQHFRGDSELSSDFADPLLVSGNDMNVSRMSGASIDEYDRAFENDRGFGDDRGFEDARGFVDDRGSVSHFQHDPRDSEDMTELNYTGDSYKIPSSDGIENQNGSAPLELQAMNLELGNSSINRDARKTKEKQQADNENFAIKFMQQFGYVPQGDSTSGFLFTASGLRDSIKTVQKFGDIPQTGELDETTLQLMTSPRCGVPDLSPSPKEGGPKGGLTTLSKQGVVVISANRSEGDDGDLRSRRPKRYILGGGGWTKRDITYHVENYSSKLYSIANVEKELRKAFDAWSSYARLNFTSVPDRDADIIIYFAEYDHYDGYPFDGQGGTLAHAYYPYEFGHYGGDIHFDESEQWAINPTDEHSGLDFFTVAVHEIGHSLGLAHSYVRSSIMFPYYKGNSEHFALDHDDVMGMYELYIKRQLPGDEEYFNQQHGSATTTTTTSTTTTTTSTTTEATTRRTSTSGGWDEDTQSDTGAGGGVDEENDDENEEEVRRKQLEEEQRRRREEIEREREEERKWYEDEARRAEEVERKREEDRKNYEEEVRRKEQEAWDRYHEEQRRRENERKTREENRRKEEEERIRKQEEERIKAYEEELRRYEEEVRRREEEERRRLGVGGSTNSDTATTRSTSSTTTNSRVNTDAGGVRGDAASGDESWRGHDVATATNAPDLCSGGLDSVAQIRDDLFMFKGEFMWRYRSRGVPRSGYPAPIRALFPGLPAWTNRVDAAYQRHNDTVIVFFIGKYYFEHRGQQLGPSQRRPLTDLGLPERVTQLDAVFHWPKNDKVYLFRHEEYWRFDELSGRMDPDYPKPMSRWHGVPSFLDAAYTWNTVSYFFKGSEFWEYDNVNVEPVQGYPKTIKDYWFPHC